MEGVIIIRGSRVIHMYFLLLKMSHQPVSPPREEELVLMVEEEEEDDFVVLQ